MPDVLGSVASLIEKAAESGGIAEIAKKGVETAGGLDTFAEGVIEAAKETEEMSTGLCSGYMGELVEEGRLLLPAKSTLDLQAEVKGINEEMLGATRAFEDGVQGYVNEGGSPESSGATRQEPTPTEVPPADNGAGSRSESSQARKVEGEVVYDGHKWLVDDIDERTKEWLGGTNGGNNKTDAEQTPTDPTILEGDFKVIGEEFTPNEEDQAQRCAEDLFREAQRRDAASPVGSRGVLGALNEVSKNPEDEEAMRLLLRIAIKIGTKVAVTIAREIAKDPHTSREMKIAMAMFADLADEGGKIADRLAAGEDKRNLSEACADYIKSRYATPQVSTISAESEE